MTWLYCRVSRNSCLWGLLKGSLKWQKVVQYHQSNHLVTSALPTRQSSELSVSQITQTFSIYSALILYYLFNISCSQAVIVDKTMYVSGQIGMDVAGNLVPGGVEAEAKQVLKLGKYFSDSAANGRILFHNRKKQTVHIIHRLRSLLKQKASASSLCCKCHMIVVLWEAFYIHWYKYALTVFRLFIVLSWQSLDNLRAVLQGGGIDTHNGLYIIIVKKGKATIEAAKGIRSCIFSFILCSFQWWRLPYC